MEFHGSKVAVFIGNRLLVSLRDDFKDIPFPACWDFAGGGCEKGETPEDCAVRELKEEFGLELTRNQLVGKTAYQTNAPAGTAYFFVAHLPEGSESNVVFGDEGQRWALMAITDYLARDDAIPHLQTRLRLYLERL
ncbi:NUDIX hydrolase [Litoreibacter janthinus]|uniref:8-oxo-dGTP diphosphatase n=1 Tax=Litoreibacter janthinus TaxID=670154 RepID=A0A1I6G4M9_9RHOB|nr:NUDIX hydrolase [Litoreibacter janthinus]SFR37070.1 8-oxo-dGTP diphosphatase [Litoreibacter janthinus]